MLDPIFYNELCTFLIYNFGNELRFEYKEDKKFLDLLSKNELNEEESNYVVELVLKWKSKFPKWHITNFKDSGYSTIDELDKLMDKKFKAICKKYDWNAQWMCARDELFDWYNSKLKLINK